MKNKILVYDDNCPLCTWYSGLFVKYGFLNAESRKAFSTLDDILLYKIDFDKSRNEIPLLDTSTNKVLYGIDALLEILAQKIPFIKAIGNLSTLKWMLERIYKLISYNRKVIVAKKCGPGSFDCSPDNNYLYRFIFMAVCLAFNTLMLFPFQSYLFSKMSYYHLNIYELQAAHFTFVIINCTLAFGFSKAKGYDYLGQVNMLALSAILLLIPLIIIQYLFYSEWFITVWLVIAAAYIFKEYLRRMEYAGVLSNNKWIVSMNLLSLTGFILFLFH
ncbi:MAG TPA: DCC1-like thiol-disulfide oxidoreductase family protein [Chitinophagaceae bacterium]|jgi:predicted DCC family thiol-disulfide oxidoreductase YuxK|nr:DCC1-like thiol-disulfide oxidoreductase family protein [Chitinophagaceae bacterium]